MNFATQETFLVALRAQFPGAEITLEPLNAFMHHSNLSVCVEGLDGYQYYLAGFVLYDEDFWPTGTPGAYARLVSTIQRALPPAWRPGSGALA